ncbi:MAG TPA: GWxTD domain-containing protein [Thermoanaerobaculaceae bacterium]|nr:GWxTD domain-containing protein [Thermoanaerobaculaceae bacterium]HRS16542.1 GWxTD domain-containing protein [Thermoanaerobaculaceae bacterium]
MRRSIIPLALLALAAAVPAAAQLSQQYTDWAAGPVSVLMTDEEKAEWSRLASDAQAEAFIELFWARRDTNPKTVPNEFKLDFEARVKAADKQFSYEKGNGENVPGSLTDRGKVLVLMGLPAGVEQLAAPSDDDRPDAMQRGAGQIWRYLKPTAKAGSTNKDDYITFTFVESRPGSKDFPFDRMDRRNKTSLKVLAERPKQFLVNKISSVAEIPRWGLVEGSLAATPSQLAVFDLEPRPWPDGAHFLATMGVASETMRPLWLHIQIPDPVQVATQAIGRVSLQGEGKVIGSFQTPVAAMSMKGYRAYELTVPVDAGEYKVEIALLAGETPIAVRSASAVSDPTHETGTFISPMYVGADPLQESNFKLGDPFNIGGWRILPRAEHIFRPSEQLAYFAYVVKPGLAENGQPRIAMGMKLTHDGKPAGQRPPTPVQVSKVGEGLFMFGQNLPLSSFSNPGEYVLELTLEDQINHVSRTSVITLNMVAEPAGEPAK